MSVALVMRNSLGRYRIMVGQGRRYGNRMVDGVSVGGKEWKMGGGADRTTSNLIPLEFLECLSLKCMVRWPNK